MRHLVAFETVAEERSFTRAARRLGYTQSAVSHQMATLERLVGRQLIERPRGTEAAHLTEAGEILHRHAQALISRVKLAYDDLDGLAEGVGGTFRFGTYQSASTSILPHVLRQFALRVPARARAPHGVGRRPLAGARSRGGQARRVVRDAAVARGAADLARAPARSLRAAGGARTRRSPSAPTAPSLGEIAQLPLIAWRSWRGVEDTMRERGYELNVIMRSDDSDTVRSLVGAGVGRGDRAAADRRSRRAASSRSRSTTCSASACWRSPGTPSAGARRCSMRSRSSCRRSARATC